jgi:hypothetical protein
LKSCKTNEAEESIQRNKLQELLRQKEQQLKKFRQDFQKMKENYEKNVGKGVFFLSFNF